MANCIWCEQRPINSLSWETLFEIGPRPGFCEACQASLDPLIGKRLCLICGRDLDKLDSYYQYDGVCQDCRTWHDTPNSEIFANNRSVYTYNEALKEMLTRYKFRGDALLIQGFKQDLRKTYRAYYKSQLAIPIPLSTERLGERTFNQAALIASCLRVPVSDAFIRVDQAQKQSKQTREERLDRQQQENFFQAQPQYKDVIKGKAVVLIDDIYTTGSTVRLAALALKKLEPKTISSFTLARG